MIRKFAALAAIAGVFAACGGGMSAEEMKAKAAAAADSLANIKKEAEARAQAVLDSTNAAVSAAKDSTTAKVGDAVEAVKEAVGH